ncbi:membrane dipeptidase [Plectosphaerella plurivora]|uniref:Dipeptidase n=1 Tax=Plectosphaerella plurivora TaxID=936078 RepID=A0A9P9ACG8_9PEZI|nr:membrane dipeptidase [Plectosphaerella plurivora]
METANYSYSKLDKEPRVFDSDVPDGSIFHHADPENGVEGVPQKRRSAAEEIAKCLFIAFFVTFGLKIFGSSAPSRESHSPEDRAHKILSHTPLIDGHNDLPILIRFLYDNHVYAKNFTEPFEHGGMTGHVDLPRLHEGQNGGAFWSVFVPCPANGTDFSDENYAASVQWTLQQIDVMNRIKQAYPKDFSPSVNSSDAEAAFKKGQFISPLGVEGLHQIGNSVANLRHFHELGVRYSTLTHNCHNRFADAAILEHPLRKAEPYWNGVSPEGRRLINEMNRIGMLVDLAHVSEDTMVDVLGGKDGWEGSRAPIIFSHSSAYSVCPHPRNVKDHVLQLVKERNSLVMVNFNPEFISCKETDSDNGIPELDPENATLAQVVKHILHIGNLIGFDHVGLGSDFDGIQLVPEGLEDVSKYPALVAELLRQGVSDEDAAKIVGSNLLRVWKDADEVALKLQAAGEPILEDDLPDLKFEDF